MSDKSDVAVKDVQSLLAKCLNCKDLELVNVESTKLLPLGENYCSIMVKLNATIRRGKGGKKEELHIVAKTPNPCERPIINWPEVFKKELFLYAELIPAYKALERQMGVEPVLDVVPKYIGHRCSLSDKPDVIDEHSMLLMENLKTRDFYNCDRRVGLDLEHARKALAALARYHTLGIALKQKRPEFFDTAIAQAQVLGIDFVQLDEGFDATLKTFRESPELSKHMATIETAFAGVKSERICEWRGAEPWVTITHGDFWVNNMLFHKDDKGHVDDVKFVDFQTYLYNSPLKDLPYFLCGSLDEKTKANDIDELLDLYYKTFVGSLERLGCSSKPFSRESFDRELKQRAIDEFPLCALAIKFFVHDVDEKHNDSSTLMTEVFNSQCSSAFLKKLRELIDVFEKRGWF